MNAIRPISGLIPDQLIERLAQARGQLWALIDCLPAGGWLGPRAEHLNPPLWEYGHIVWFQERWIVRERPNGTRAPSLLDRADALYDSSTVAHASRWDLSLSDPATLDDYSSQVTAAVADRLHNQFDNETAYFAELSLAHELMHIEAWWMAFQSLGYAPPFCPDLARALPAPRLVVDAGEVVLGSGSDAGFVFDNEKWRHPVTVAAFDIDAMPVLEQAFAGFVEAGGYQHKKLWSEAGWAWRQANDAGHPLYWRQHNGFWQARRFDRWLPIGDTLPVRHVNRFEAEAYAAWQGRRLPSAAEWVRAAAEPVFDWGNVWEWLRDPFAPYPGFSPDPYSDYSAPWFHTHAELRGGGPFTDPLLKRPGFRNFYLPHRRDPFAGFRTVSPG